MFEGLRLRQRTAEKQQVPGITRLLQRWMRVELRNRIAVNVKDGSVLVYVPAGEFDMGDGQGGDCPTHRVELSAYWIGVYGVTNAQYKRFVDATGHRAPDQADYGQWIWTGKRFLPEMATHPVVCVSWEDADAYARWAGCRLPTEAQWEKAARYPSGWIYPWGDDWEGGEMCRHYGNKGRENTAPVYAYSEGVSVCGAYNQSGNVWEWCADWYSADYYGKSPPKDPAGPQRGITRVYRGGSWRLDDDSYFRGSYRHRYGPDYRDDGLGFRLVRAAS